MSCYTYSSLKYICQHYIFDEKRIYSGERSKGMMSDAHISQEIIYIPIIFLRIGNLFLERGTVTLSVVSIAKLKLLRVHVIISRTFCKLTIYERWQRKKPKGSSRFSNSVNVKEHGYETPATYTLTSPSTLSI